MRGLPLPDRGRALRKNQSVCRHRQPNLGGGGFSSPCARRNGEEILHHRSGKPGGIGVQQQEQRIAGQNLVTSGSYQRYYTVDGRDYHHIIDPDTLMPADYFVSVTVLADDSGKADALSTALFNLPYEAGKELAESLDGVEAFWVEPDGTEHCTDGFQAVMDDQT